MKKSNKELCFKKPQDFSQSTSSVLEQVTTYQFSKLPGSVLIEHLPFKDIIYNAISIFRSLEKLKNL